LVRRKDRIIACREHHAPVAQQAEASRSEREQCEFDSHPAYHVHIDISSLRQAAKASGLHPDIRRFESVREYQFSVTPNPSVAQRQSNRPITGRPRIVTVRKDQGISSVRPEWRGSGLLSRAHVDRNHRNPPSTRQRRTTSIKVMQRSLKPRNTDRYRGGPPYFFRSGARIGAPVHCSVTHLVRRLDCRSGEREAVSLRSANSTARLLLAQTEEHRDPGPEGGGSSPPEKPIWSVPPEWSGSGLENRGSLHGMRVRFLGAPPKNFARSRMY
jgi:hypothetical protein